MGFAGGINHVVIREEYRVGAYKYAGLLLIEMLLDGLIGKRINSGEHVRHNGHLLFRAGDHDADIAGALANGSHHLIDTALIDDVFYFMLRDKSRSKQCYYQQKGRASIF